MSNQAEKIWATLSRINVNEHTEVKDKFTYLSWTWAWATVKEHYPTANFRFVEDRVHSGGSVEVWCEVTIEGLTHQMWLAVTDFKNKAVPNPSCDLIANARMRCLVKCCAMFGLGHYIYAGESLPMEPTLDTETKDALLMHMANKDSIKFTQLYRSLTDQHREMFFGSFSQGHKSSQKEAVRNLIKVYNNLLEGYYGDLITLLEADDRDGFKQVLDELNECETTKHDVNAMMSDSDRARVAAYIKEIK